MIKNISDDSREIKAGWLFAAIKGTNSNGEDFIPQAIAQGASAILARPEAAHLVPPTIEFIAAENPRQALAKLANDFYQPQPKNIVAITGTDGKTSTAEFTRQLWEFLGKKSASIGTLGVRGFTSATKVENTTPGSITLHRLLQEMAQANIQNVAMEASSHGLHQYRLDGVTPCAAIFTTFGSDHGDYHPTSADYFAAKARLFTEILESDKIAVINADDAAISSFKYRQKTLRSFGMDGNFAKIISAQPTAKGIAAEIELAGTYWQGNIPLYGSFQLMNILAAASAIWQAESDTATLLNALPQLQGVAGRLQCAGVHVSGAPIFIDYAHTAQALEKILHCLRPHTKNRLLLVFGCGGERDKSKRPLMGKIAEELADIIIITDDNPRNEDPKTIRQEILNTCPKAQEIGNRRTAIESAIAQLQTGDLLVIAGKGHETTQIIAGKSHHHDDAVVVRNFL